MKFPLALRLVLSSLPLGLELYGLPIYYICHVLPPSPPFHFTLRQRPLQSATATSPPNCLARSPMAGEEFGLAAAAAAAASATVDAASGRSSRVTALRSVEDIFSDFRARRSAIVRALTEGR